MLIDYRVDVGLGPYDPGDQDELATAVGLDTWLGDHDGSEPGVIVERLSCLIRVEGPLLLEGHGIDRLGRTGRGKGRTFGGDAAGDPSLSDSKPRGHACSLSSQGPLRIESDH